MINTAKSRIAYLYTMIFLMKPHVTFAARVDEGFPNVTFHFENSVFLRVYPHDYLFPYVSIFSLFSWFVPSGYLFYIVLMKLIFLTGRNVVYWLAK